MGWEVAERFKVLIGDGNHREREIGLLKLHRYTFGLAALWALAQHQRCRLRLDRLGNQRVYAGLVQFQKHQFSVRILQAVCVGHHRSTQDSLQVLALWDIWILPIAELCAV